MEIALLLLGIFFGVLTSRASTIAARGGIEPTTPITAYINFGSVASTFVIIIWGFMNQPWWLPLTGFIIISILVGAIIGRANWAFFYQAIPITGLITITITISVWLL